MVRPRGGAEIDEVAVALLRLELLQEPTPVVRLDKAREHVVAQGGHGFPDLGRNLLERGTAGHLFALGAALADELAVQLGRDLLLLRSRHHAAADLVDGLEFAD